MGLYDVPSRMPSWRASIGVIACSGENIGERQFAKVLPEGVVAHFTRISRRKPVEVSLEDMILGERLKSTAILIAEAKPDLIVFDDHSWSFEKGVGWDETVARRITEVTGIPAVTMTTGVVAALKTLNVSKIAAIGPWNDDKVQRLKDFHKGHGIDIINYSYVPPEILLNVPDHAYYKLLKNVNMPEVEALLACFSGERSLEAIEALEKDLCKPVIGAIQATIWYALQKIGIREPINGYGILLRTQLKE